MRTSARRPRLAASLVVAGTLTLTACAGGDDPSATKVSSSNWPQVLADAKGQTVNWYMYGGKDEVKPQLARVGVTLKQVRITDTADAVNKVLGEKQAGRTSGGAVDAIWVNGENFATGVQADIWSCGWAGDLPNAKYVDFQSPAVTHDFGVPFRGCESVWQQANSALVYDSADLYPTDVASVESLLAWAKAHPGRFTYPSPPDFTGSMAVRSLLYAQLGGPSTLAGPFDEQTYTIATKDFYAHQNAIEPTLWREGKTYPTSQDIVDERRNEGDERLAREHEHPVTRIGRQ